MFANTGKLSRGYYFFECNEREKYLPHFSVLNKIPTTESSRIGKCNTIKYCYLFPALAPILSTTQRKVTTNQFALS